MPSVPALVPGLHCACWMTPDGEIDTLDLDRIRGRLGPESQPLLCHARAVAKKLGIASLRGHDVLELFAFVRPAVFCLPTPRGLAEALDLPIPGSIERQAESLFFATRALLDELANKPSHEKAKMLALAWAMTRGDWPWGTAVLSALGAGDEPHSRNVAEGLKVWQRLKDFEDEAPDSDPGNWPVEPVEARARLTQLLGHQAENRPQQMDYASDAAQAFMPRDHADKPNLVLAEAGTGVGKTLGYIAPASVWAEKNQAPVWISTYTRNLQRQLDGELSRLYPDETEKAEKVVVRKGRENYFCLLNFEEAVRRVEAIPGSDATFLGLMARWAEATRDGDMIGGDFPAWLMDLFGLTTALDLTDTRGECTYAACAHYRKCFIEKSIRKARKANIVVANHALVMVQAALGGGDDIGLPSRYVMDEGHHVFDAADSAFSAHLSGHEGADLRRWLLGAEGQGRSRSRGLRSRVEDLGAGNEELMEALEEVLKAARILPGPGWHQRIGGGEPHGATEQFLALVRQQVYARDNNADSPYSIETETQPPVDGMVEVAQKLEEDLARFAKPLKAMIKALARMLDEEADELESNQRGRIESLMRSLDKRGIMTTTVWREMLKSLTDGTPDTFVDWFAVDRKGGYDRDVGMHRHFLDPTKPLAEMLLEPAQGVLITSATLTDGIPDDDANDDGWPVAKLRTGANHLMAPPYITTVKSPFDYAATTKVFIVGDLNRNNSDHVSAAYRELFLASGGGGLGLFTAINRLTTVHRKIAPALDEAGIGLLAQHVEGMDTGTLIDIFRAEENMCLLGTDAVRDGVDVPGKSLRLIVFDRVPWPRPDILHKARKNAFGGKSFEETLTRLKLKQAYGRLIRRDGDRGVFVMLDRAMPTRLTTAFPKGVEIIRCGLKEAIEGTREFLKEEE